MDSRFLDFDWSYVDLIIKHDFETARPEHQGTIYLDDRYANKRGRSIVWNGMLDWLFDPHNKRCAAWKKYTREQVGQLQREWDTFRDAARELFMAAYTFYQHQPQHEEEYSEWDLFGMEDASDEEALAFFHKLDQPPKKRRSTRYSPIAADQAGEARPQLYLDRQQEIVETHNSNRNPLASWQSTGAIARFIKHEIHDVKMPTNSWREIARILNLYYSYEYGALAAAKRNSTVRQAEDPVDGLVRRVQKELLLQRQVADVLRDLADEMDANRRSWESQQREKGTDERVIHQEIRRMREFDAKQIDAVRDRLASMVSES